MQSIGRPHRPPRLPVVLSVAKVRAVLALIEVAGGAVRSPLDALQAV